MTYVSAGIINASGIPPGAVAYYDYESGSGSTLVDQSGNGNDGTINGATWTTESQYGSYGLSFDGTDDYVDISSAAGAVTDGDFTLGTWTYIPSGDSVNNPAAVSLGIPSNWTDDVVILRIGDEGGDDVAVYCDGTMVIGNQTLVDDDRWQHFVVRRSGDTFDLFRDATLEVSNTQTVGTWTSTYAGIGAANDGSTIQHYFGYQDETAIYDRALTDDEITDLYSKSSS